MHAWGTRPAAAAEARWAAGGAAGPPPALTIASTAAFVMSPWRITSFAVGEIGNVRLGPGAAMAVMYLHGIATHGPTINVRRQVGPGSRSFRARCAVCAQQLCPPFAGYRVQAPPAPLPQGWWGWAALPARITLQRLFHHPAAAEAAAEWCCSRCKDP